MVNINLSAQIMPLPVIARQKSAKPDAIRRCGLLGLEIGHVRLRLSWVRIECRLGLIRSLWHLRRWGTAIALIGLIGQIPLRIGGTGQKRRHQQAGSFEIHGFLFFAS
jgi:hypothetical protein